LRPAAVPLAAVALCAALPAAAQQTGPTLSGSYGVAFTGESDPNARASLSLSLEAEMNGLYVGTENFVYRGSVLNEHDLYMGVRTALNPKLNLDLSLNHFHYPNDPGMSYSTLMLILDGQVSDALYANLEVNAYLEWGGYDAGLILSYTPPAVPNLSLGIERQDQPQRLEPVAHRSCRCRQHRMGSGGQLPDVRKGLCQGLCYWRHADPELCRA
jgi:hypothetical protein